MDEKCWKKKKKTSNINNKKGDRNKNAVYYISTYCCQYEY